MSTRGIKQWTAACGGAGILALGLAATSANGDTVFWTGANSNNWSDDANWSQPPQAGDDLVIGNGTDAFTAVADAQLDNGDPATITVLGNAEFRIKDANGFDPFAGPDDVEVTMQSGSTFWMRRNATENLKLILQDGSNIEVPHGGFVGNPDNPDWSVSGDVTVTSLPGPGGQRVFDPDLVGTGNLHFTFADDTDDRPLKMGGGHTGYFGDLFLGAGDSEAPLYEWQTNRGDGIMTNGDIHVEAGVDVIVNFEDDEVQPFSDTTILSLAGTGANKATLTFTDTSASGQDTLLGLVLGGVAVPNGTYTTSELNALNGGQFAGYIFTNDGSGAPVDYTWTIIPEPASVALLGMGGALMLARRRQRI